MDEPTDLRLIEAGFPCHQVGAETQREQSVGLQPPVNRLHVWWARRPLTPSRAAIVASLDPAATDPETFIRQLGIECVQALVYGEPWTITGKLLERLKHHDGAEVLPVDAVVLRALRAEEETRRANLDFVERLASEHPDLASDPALRRWRDECKPFPTMPEEGDDLTIIRVVGDPAWANGKMAFAAAQDIRFPGDPYGYQRAFANITPYRRSTLTILDPTSGGGSIPFEALRLGHRVIANELNPVAAAILHATIDFPARFGPDLLGHIEDWGHRLLRELDRLNTGLFADGQRLPHEQRRDLEKRLGIDNTALIEEFDREHIQDYIYARQVTCPHCGGDAPLLNTCWLSKAAKDAWGVRIVPQGGKVRFETYQVKGGRGPNGEDPDTATVNRGTGQCVHCKQAIDGDEVKRQARGELPHGKWQDRLYAVVAVRFEPKLDSRGRPQRYSSGARKGEIKTTKVRYFRSPNERDLEALAESEGRLAERWDAWDAEGLIPTEGIPPGHRRDQRDGLLRYGVLAWLDMFTPRQLMGHLTLIDGLNRIKPDIIAKLGEERGRAVVTYLQFAIDKGLDYNCRHTTWEFTRGTVKHIFARHDFSLKWT